MSLVVLTEAGYRMTGHRFSGDIREELGMIDMSAVIVTGA
jgi:hypothetical protein